MPASNFKSIYEARAKARGFWGLKVLCYNKHVFKKQIPSVVRGDCSKAHMGAWSGLYSLPILPLELSLGFFQNASIETKPFSL